MHPFPRNTSGIRSTVSLHRFYFFVGVEMITNNLRFRDMVKLILANPEKTRPIIDRVFTFNEAIDAFDHQESQQHVGKTVIKVA